MATPNKALEQPARGSNVGVWDTPVNANMGIIDNSFGGVATIPLVATDVTLSPSQYQCTFITLTGALSANVSVIFPPVGSFYTIQNLTTNTSAFQVTLKTTAGGQVIGAPWGETVDIMTDTSHTRYKNFGRVGTYWDYAGSSTPAWVTLCSVPPYLMCDGGVFSSAIYPTLFTVLGGGVLPDARGRTRFNLNGGTARLTSTGGIDGDTRLAAGGSGTGLTVAQANLPAITIVSSVTDPGHTHIGTANSLSGGAGGSATPSGAAGGGASTFGVTISSCTTGITVNTPLGGSGTPLASVSPGFVGGICMIRAA